MINDVEFIEKNDIDIDDGLDDEEERIESDEFGFNCEKEYLIDCITREAIETGINYIDLLEIRYTELWLKMHEIKGCVKDF